MRLRRDRVGPQVMTPMDTRLRVPDFRSLSHRRCALAYHTEHQAQTSRMTYDIEDATSSSELHLVYVPVVQASEYHENSLLSSNAYGG